MRTAWGLIAAALAVVALAAEPLAAEQKPAAAEADAGAKVILPWDTFKKITGYDEAKPEQAGMFTLSWDEVQTLLGIKIENVGQGTKIRIPWQEFKNLLVWSINQKKKPESPPPPTDFAITSAEYVGTLAKDGAVFNATFKITLLKDNVWKVIPLLPATVAIQEVKLPQGAYLRLANNFYELLTAAPPSDIVVTATFAAAVTEQAGSNTLRFERVPSGTCLLDLKVAQTAVDIAVTGAQSTVKKEDAGATRVLAALPAAAPVQLSWERAIPEAEKVPPKLYADTQTLVAVGDGILIGRQRIKYNILHTGVRMLKLKLPKGVSILEVKGERTRDWRVTQDELNVALASEVMGDYMLNVTYEQPTAAEQTAGSLPILRATDVVREKGHIGVVALANVELSAPQLKGATAIDVRELPPELLAITTQPILLAYRYVADTFDIPLVVKKHADVNVLVTIIDSAVITTMQTMEGRRITKVVYNVRNNRQQFLRLAMPESVDIWSASVSGKSIRPAKDDENRILVPLVRSEGAASGLAAFPVELVYVEKGGEAAKPGEPPVKPLPSGTLHIVLPRSSEPVTHLMVNLYLPKEGKYTRPWSSEPAIEGPLTVVKAFRKLVGTLEEPAVQAEEAAQVLQQAAQAQTDAATAATGATPIRVNLPIDGQLFRLEKILVLDEPLFLDVHYSGWEKK
ncbi:MAG: hypothetical protein NTU94_13265 [Planctomycetota bacterium]|nr:hypothetical protein [Planctomycetota bacterium]